MKTTPVVAVRLTQDRADDTDAASREDSSGDIDYRAVVAAVGDCTTVTGADGRFRHVSRACRRLVGWTESELEQSPADDFVHPDDRLAFQEGRAGLAPGELQTLSYRFRCRDGSFRWVEETCEVVSADDAVVVVASVRDITKRHARVAALERRAASDPLTGVANRTVLIDRLRHGLSRLTRGHGGLAVLYLDLDRFKVVNDSLGHRVGDGVLLQMAQRLTSHLRPSDTLARLGGDEFVIVAEDLEDEEDAVEVANRIVETTRRPFKVLGEGLECTVSVGLAFTSDAGRGAEELLHDADLALYRAKDRGRDRVEVYDEDLRSAAIGRMATERMVRRALDEDRLVVEYQPIIDLRTGQVRGVEALVRIQDPEEGIVLPNSFLDVAEEAGLLMAIDEHVLADAVRQASGWRSRLGGAWQGGIAINLTARLIAGAGFCEAVLERLDHHGVPHEELQVEVTERVLMEAPSSALTGLQSLRDSGVQVGLDDFGTGFSSLACLRQFPLDYIKIDGAFIEDLERDEAERPFVAAIIELAHALGLFVTAEGVETFGQRKILKALGCDRVQGFLFAPPGHPRAVDEIVLCQPQLAISR